MIEENYDQPCSDSGEKKKTVKFDFKSIKTSKGHLLSFIFGLVAAFCKAEKFTFKNKPTLRNLLEQKKCDNKPWSPLCSCQEWFVIILLSHQVTIFRLRESLISLFLMYTYIHKHTHKHSTGLREPKTNNVKLQTMQVAGKPLSSVCESNVYYQQSGVWM